MLCSSQNKNTWGLIFCQQNLAQRCSHTWNRQKLHSQRGRQAVFAGLEAELLLLMAGWLYCGIERHKEKTPGSRPQAVWHSTRNVSAAQLFQVQLGQGVTIPTCSLLLLCAAWAATGASCCSKRGQLPLPAAGLALVPVVPKMGLWLPRLWL